MAAAGYLGFLLIVPPVLWMDRRYGPSPNCRFHPGFDLDSVSQIVLSHEPRDITEGHLANPFLSTAAEPRGLIHSSERGDVAPPRFRERGETGLERKSAVVSFNGDFRTVEVRQVRLILAQEPADSFSEAFAFQVCKMPDLFHRRECAV